MVSDKFHAGQKVWYKDENGQRQYGIVLERVFAESEDSRCIWPSSGYYGQPLVWADWNQDYSRGPDPSVGFMQENKVYLDEGQPNYSVIGVKPSANTNNGNLPDWF